MPSLQAIGLPLPPGRLHYDSRSARSDHVFRRLSTQMALPTVTPAPLRFIRSTRKDCWTCGSKKSLLGRLNSRWGRQKKSGYEAGWLKGLVVDDHSHSGGRYPFVTMASKKPSEPVTVEEDGSDAEILRATVWSGYAFYMIWLFLNPDAPGEAVWQISQETISFIIDLSLNFFFILPALNAVGIHTMEAPILHPASESLFNVVNAWSFMFGPLLLSDYRKKFFNGSVLGLWSGQMFLTNVFLIPYMALRLQASAPTTSEDGTKEDPQAEKFGQSFVDNSKWIGIVGGAVTITSLAWFAFGRLDGDFGGIPERWQYLVASIQGDRLAYAFLWDVVLYSIFQSWIIGDNIRHSKSKGLLSSTDQEFVVDALGILRFFPCFGLVAYLMLMPNLSYLLDKDES